MDQFRLAIAVMAATNSQWGPRDADGRRRAFTAEELDALVDFGWHWPDLKGAMAACANAVRSLWQSRGGDSVASPRSLAPPSILGWTERREPQMSTSRRTRITIPTFGAVLLFALAAPIAVNAEDDIITAAEQILAAAPAASWDETSGYGAVEANRAAASALRAPVAIPSWDEASGYGVVEEIRAAIGHDVVSGFGATGHEASAASGLSWDDTSGYGAVEASRAANAMPVAALSDLGTGLAAGTP